MDNGKTMLLAGNAANIIYLILRFPIRALLFPSFVIGREAITASEVLAFFSDKDIIDIGKTPPLFQLTCDCHIVPILEEIIYRYFFYKVWSFLKEKFANNKSLSSASQSEDEETTKLWFGLKPWILVSSAIFAAGHFTNHLPTKSDAEIQSIIEYFTNNIVHPGYNTDDPTFALSLSLYKTFHIAKWRYYAKYIPVVRAMIQGFITFVLSVYLLCPAFERRGVLGSIAAHSTWNLFARTIVPLQLSIRYLERRRRNKKRKAEA